MNRPESPIFRVRAAYGLTQEQLAEALGFSRNYMHLLEAGVKPLSRSVLEAIDRFSKSQEEKRKQKVDPVPPREPHHLETPSICGTAPAPAERSTAERLDRIEAQLQTLTQLLGATLATSVPHASLDVSNHKQKAG